MLCREILQLILSMVKLIHSADPQSRTVVIIIFAHVSVRPSVRPHFSKYRKTKQTSFENIDRYLWGSRSGRVDHWCHYHYHSTDFSYVISHRKYLAYNFELLSLRTFSHLISWSPFKIYCPKLFEIVSFYSYVNILLLIFFKHLTYHILSDLR